LRRRSQNGRAPPHNATPPSRRPAESAPLTSRCQASSAILNPVAERAKIVWWLDSENAVLFMQQYADLADTLGCAESGALPDAVRRPVLSDLHHRRRWLVIFDNAEDPDALREWLPSSPGHVLITSRSADWDELAAPVPVDVLTRAESVRLIRARVPRITAADADTLAEALGDLPLAIAQAAGGLNRSKQIRSAYSRNPEAAALETLRSVS
jgi:hypothetical protein